MPNISKKQMQYEEKLVVLYFLSTMKLNPNSSDAHNGFAPFECMGANTAECLQFTGLTEDRVMAAIARLNTQGAEISIGCGEGSTKKPSATPTVEELAPSQIASARQEIARHEKRVKDLERRRLGLVRNEEADRRAEGQ